MNRSAHLVAKDPVHELVLLDPVESLEAVGHDLRAEVVTTSGEVVHVYPRTGKRVLDALLELSCLGHALKIAAAG